MDQVGGSLPGYLEAIIENCGTASLEWLADGTFLNAPSRSTAYFIL